MGGLVVEECVEVRNGGGLGKSDSSSSSSRSSSSIGAVV